MNHLQNALKSSKNSRRKKPVIRGRIPRRISKMEKKYNKHEFVKIMKPIHKQFTDKTYKKLVGKLGNLRSSLKKRALDAGLKFDVTTNQLRKLFYDNYGKKCKYCNEAVLKINKINQITCDHIVPIQKGGDSTIDNLQLICSTCNRRKGSLSEDDFLTILVWVRQQKPEIKNYLLKQMAKGGEY